MHLTSLQIHTCEKACFMSLVRTTGLNIHKHAQGWFSIGMPMFKHLLRDEMVSCTHSEAHHVQSEAFKFFFTPKIIDLL